MALLRKSFLGPGFNINVGSRLKTASNCTCAAQVRAVVTNDSAVGLIIPAEREVATKRSVNEGRWAIELRQMAPALGPAYVKPSQALRMRSGILSRSASTELQESRDEDATEEEENIRPEGSGGKGDDNGEGGGSGGGGGGGGDAVGWISSALIFLFWAGLIFYASTLAPNQTQYRDAYFIKKLVGLQSDDGFVMNKVLVAEFYIMGVWPLIYTSLLIPNGRSRENGVKVWPFSVVSFFVGAFALLPYFGLWRPPPPKVSKDELRRYPVNVLESKITAVAIVIGAIGLAWYAGTAGGDQWAEFVDYLQGSRFIHVMTVDFWTLSALAPFWVYNDLSTRLRPDTTSWLPALAAIPFLGPALYLLLRPPLTPSRTGDSEDTSAGSGS